MRLFPGVTARLRSRRSKPAIYYDIDSHDRRSREADFPRIEEEMRKIVADA